MADMKRGRPKDLENAEQRRKAIIATAADAFARYGYSQTDIGEVAKAMNVSKGTIYYYFKNKEKLFLTCVDWLMQRLLELSTANLDPSRDAIDLIQDGIESYLVFFDQHPMFVELLIQERAIFKHREKPTYFKHRAERVPVWQSWYSRLMEIGRVREMPVEQITDCIGDLLYGAVFTNYFSGRVKPMKQHARDIMDIVFNGILSDSERNSYLKRKAKG